eukprot:TRINITY_DN14664_c0_g1_i1.p1 TRINITY_DN14664_c0_g1~~TRINITY_DN14664_c0_g1_i1.p1  ORF type:complete len:451 (+),score=86.62 TRINITY_DN14664_c0_g1_i1:43-1395(+)
MESLSGNAHQDVARFMELRDDFASQSGGTQTDASTVCFDMTKGAFKFADTHTIKKSLNRASSHDPIKAAKGCEETSWLALEATNRKTIGTADGVEILLRAMQRWMGKRSAIVQICMEALSRLLTADENADSFYEHETELLKQLEEESGYAGGGTLLVVAAMSGYPLKTDLQMHGCSIARALVQHKLYLKRFLQYGMIGQVLTALEKHAECSRLVVHALNCLREVTATTDEAALWMVHEGVVLDYFAEALKNHVENTEVVWTVSKMLLRVQRFDALREEVRKTTLIQHVLVAGDTHANNTDLSKCLLLVLAPQVGFYPSRIDEMAVCVKKIMSHSCEEQLLTVACHLCVSIAKAAPDDMVKLRLSRHLVPYISACLEAFSPSLPEDAPLLHAARVALASLVVHKHSTALGKPRRVANTTTPPVKHRSFLLLAEAATCPLKLDWKALALGVY